MWKLLLMQYTLFNLQKEAKGSTMESDKDKQKV